MEQLKYVYNRGFNIQPLGELNLDINYLISYKSDVEKKLAPFIGQIIEDGAEIELYVSIDGKSLTGWKIINWNEQGYDKLQEGQR